MSKLNLKHILPTSVLREIIPAFEAIFGIEGAVSVYNADSTRYFGQDKPAQSTAETLLVDNQVVGHVDFHVGEFTPTLSNALKYLALNLSTIATEVWRRNRLSEEVIERYDELNLIYSLGMSFIQGLSQDQIVKNVLAETNRIVHADAGVVYLWDAARSSLVPASDFGANVTPDFWEGRTRELALSALYAYEEAQLFDSEKVVCAPLRYNQEMLGALVLLHEREDETFNANDCNLLTTLTNNTALFIYATRLRERVEQRNAELEQRKAELEKNKAELEETLHELKSTQDKLSRAERLSIIGQTVGGLVHDMKNPMNIIMGYAGMLEDDIEISTDERRMFASEIVKYVKVFTAMAQEILDYTLGADNVQKVPVLLNDFLRDVNDLLVPRGLQRDVSIIVKIEDADDYQVVIDRDRFARVFQNLVNNSIDAIESQGGSRIEVAAQPVGDMIEFTVTDDGPGVPPHIVNTIFEPFVTFGKPRGTGLGLAIVSHMVKIHGGTIRYESPNGRGARFVFTIPQYVTAPTR